MDLVQPFLHSHHTFSFFRFLTRLHTIKLNFVPLHLFLLLKKKTKVRNLFSVNTEELLGWLVVISFSFEPLELSTELSLEKC